LNEIQQTFAMSDNWLTYAQAPERLNQTVEAVRLRALRGRWQKTIGNDKTARATAAFEALAWRLEAMAEAKWPSWWRWLRFAD
jgi:hypothetical protein